MTTSEERRAANDKRVAADIRQYGCHVITVLPGDDGTPTFTYSVGIYESSGAPEAIVIGLPTGLAGFAINEYNRKVRSGARFSRGIQYSGFLEGFSVFIEPVSAEAAKGYTLGCSRYYRDKGNYSVVQIVYPNKLGVWPWEREADAWLKANQPMLGRARPDRT